MFVYGKRSIDRDYTVVEWGQSEDFSVAAAQMIATAREELINYFIDNNLMTNTEQYQDILTQIELLSKSIIGPGIYRLRTRFDREGGRPFFSSLFIREVRTRA